MDKFQIPTLTQLNQLTAGEASILLLRLLNTSDLSFFHSLFKTDTLEDILSVTQSLLQLELSEGMEVDVKAFSVEYEHVKEEVDMQLAYKSAKGS